MFLDERVRADLAASTRFTDIRILEITDSTNRVVAEIAANGAPEGVVVAADLQTAGRGRLDRTWEAQPGSSLLVSVLLRPAGLPVSRWHLVTAAAGLAARDACAETAGFRPDLKWPNDLVAVTPARLGPQPQSPPERGDPNPTPGRDSKPAGGPQPQSPPERGDPNPTPGRDHKPAGGPQPQSPPERGDPNPTPGRDRKLAGVLAESTAGAAVVGMGLNVHSGPPGSAWLDDLAGRRVSRSDLLVSWLRRFHWLLDDWDLVATRYRTECSTVGRLVEVEQADRRIIGIAEDIDSGGRLIVRPHPDDHTGLSGGRGQPGPAEPVAVSAGDVIHLRPA